MKNNFKKSKNKKILTLFFKSFLLTSSIVTPICITTIVQKTNNYETDAFLDSNSLIKQINKDCETQSIKLPNNLAISINSPRSIISTPEGIFLPTNKGLALLNSNTFEQKWIIENNSDIYYSKYILDISQEESAKGSILIVRKKDNSSLALDLIDVEKGEIFDSTLINITEEINDQNSCYVTEVQNEKGKFIFTINGLMTNNERNNNTFLITLDDKGFVQSSPNNPKGIEKITLFETQGNHETTVFSLGQVSINDSIYSFNLQYYTQDGKNEVYFLVTKMNKTDSEIDFENFWKFQDKTFEPSNFLISDIKLIVKQNVIEFSLISNFSKESNNVIKGSFNTTSEKLENIQLISLDKKNGDFYDISYGYYLKELDKWITYCSYNSLINDRGSIVLFDLNNIKKEDLKPTSDNVKVLTTNTNEENDVLTINNNDFWIPIIPYDAKGDLDQKNILLFNANNSSFKNNIIKLSTKSSFEPIKPINPNEPQSPNINSKKLTMSTLIGGILCISGGILLIIIVLIMIIKSKKNKKDV